MECGSESFCIEQGSERMLLNYCKQDPETLSCQKVLLYTFFLTVHRTKELMRNTQPHAASSVNLKSSGK